MSEPAPLCLSCRHRQQIEWSEHSRCRHWSAQPEIDEAGLRRGRVVWPIYFDVRFVRRCKGFDPITAEGLR